MHTVESDPWCSWIARPTSTCKLEELGRKLTWDKNLHFRIVASPRALQFDLANADEINHDIQLVNTVLARE